MTQSDQISKLETTLETLHSLTDKMKGPSGVHQIDIDLLQQKTRELYEQIILLEPVSFEPVEEETPLPHPEHAPEPEPEPKSEVESQPESQPESEPEPELEPEPENITQPQPEDEVVRENEQKAMEETGEPSPEMIGTSEPEPEEDREEVFENAETENSEETFEQENPETPGNGKTTLDLFAGSNDDSVAAILSQQAKQTDVGERLGRSLVGDLREAIDINDKFQLVNELFNGDLEQYNKVLDELNGFASLQGALTYLSELSVQYDFNKSGMAFQRLKTVLSKKYV